MLFYSDIIINILFKFYIHSDMLLLKSNSNCNKSNFSIFLFYENIVHWGRFISFF